MSNQIVISSGAKVRSLEGVLTGTAGIVNSVPLGGANGVATLDSNGKVPLSQLPASVVTYLGTWNAATNTPTLVNGTGDTGDLYICNVAGTVNFGAGPITFAVGDWVIYNGSQWQKSAGASGTVTSVAVTESGDALTITGSPITTAGTINIGFAGTGSQYIKGDGTLATFPTTIDQAKRLITEVYNSTGATLTKGTVVYINGGQGNLPTVTKAQANSDATSAQTYGVVQSDITNMNNGFVVVFGSITDIDTQAYAVGTQLYLSGTTAGEWTSTKPSAPIHLVYVGIVVRSHPTQGVVEIRIQNGYELEELHDVAISAPVNNQGIFYNSSNDLWENKSIATALGYTPANDALVVKLAGTQTITGVKTFDAGLSLKDAVYPTPLSGYSSIGANPFGISIVTNQSSTIYRSDLGFPAAQRTYTFPNADGTIALTSNLSSYVPYSGATGNVNLGTNNLTASNLFGETSLNVKILGSGSIYSTGYSTFSTLAGKLTLAQEATAGNLKAFTFDFSAWSTNTSYTYTLPAINGTLALLEGTQTFTGAKTFSTINVTNASTLDGNLLLKKAGIAVTTSTYVTQFATSSGVGIGYSDGTGGANFTFPTASIYTYTFPAATGTLALTSDLGNYVTLDTTQTITGAKTFTTGVTKFRDVYVEGSGTSASGVNLKQSSGGIAYAGAGYMTINAFGTKQIGILDGATQTNAYISLNSITSGLSRTYTLPDGNGTLVLGTGTTNYLPKFTGASTLGNSLIFDNGTGVGINTSTVPVRFTIANPDTRIEFDQLNSTTSYLEAINTGRTTTNFFSMYTRGLNIWTRPSGTGTYAQSMTITDTGNVGIGTSSVTDFGSSYTVLDVYNGTVGGYLLARSPNVTGQISVDNNTAMYVQTRTNHPILFAVNNTERMRLTAGGRLAIGRTTPGTSLSVAGQSEAWQLALSTDTGAGAVIGSPSANVLAFGDWSGTERMRLNSTGALLIGTTTDPGAAARLGIVNGFGMEGLCVKMGSTGAYSPIAVRDTTGAEMFNIRENGAMDNPYAYNTTTGSAANVFVNTIGRFLRSSSSLKYKTDVRDYDKGLAEVLQMRPVYYKGKSEDDGDTQFAGLIAEEIHDLGLTEFVQYANDNTPDALAYQNMVALLTKAIQEQQAQIEELKAKIK